MDCPQGKALRAKILVEDCVALMGSTAADLLLFFAATDRAAVFSLITSVLNDLPGIRETTTVDAFSYESLTVAGPTLPPPIPIRSGIAERKVVLTRKDNRRGKAE
jgi:hypothetical protein